MKRARQGPSVNPASESHKVRPLSNSSRNARGTSCRLRLGREDHISVSAHKFSSMMLLVLVSGLGMAIVHFRFDESSSPTKTLKFKPSIINSQDLKYVLTAHQKNASQSSLVGESESFTTTMKIPRIDILSVGSLKRPEYQDAQKHTMGHFARNFFSVSELNDTADPTCHSGLTMDHVQKISTVCRKPVHRTGMEFSQLDRMRLHSYAAFRWLRKKADPVGWICAQKRPLDGFAQVLRLYQKQRTEQIVGTEMTDTILPDYFWVTDDDTWINMPATAQFLSSHYPSTESHVVAGCRIRAAVNYTLPFGGFGTLLTRVAIERFMTPLYCHSENITSEEKDWFERMACLRLDQNLIGERALFRKGMSVADLMYAYAKEHSYENVSNWDLLVGSFCLHSDWAWGYFINYYHIAFSYFPNSQTEMSLWNDKRRGKSRGMVKECLVGYNGSLIDGSLSQHQRGSSADLEQRKECFHRNDKLCTLQSHVCHNITASRMLELKPASLFNSSRSGPW